MGTLRTYCEQAWQANYSPVLMKMWKRGSTSGKVLEEPLHCVVLGLALDGIPANLCEDVV